MAYSSGGLVEAVDYNALAGRMRSQMGVGTSNHGLGQSVTAIADTAATAAVTAAQWTSLIQSANSCLSHEGQTLITPASVTAGNIVTYYAAIDTGTTLAYNSTGTTGLALTDSAATASTYSSSWGTSGNRGLLFTHTVTFASGDAARYFFNAGGRLKLSFAKSGGSSTTRNTEWAALATACGSIQMTHNDYVKVGGSGTLSNLQHDGYYGLTSAPVQKFNQTDGVASYSTNYIKSDIAWSGTAANGGSPIITIQTYWMNVWSNAYQDAVDGTTTTNLVVSSPSTSYLTNSWGTPTVSQSVALY